MRKKVLEACRLVNCPKIDAEGYCICYMNPAVWWKPLNPYLSKCPIPKVEQEIAQKLHVINPLKKSKLKIKGSLNLGYKIKKANYDGKWLREKK